MKKKIRQARQAETEASVLSLWRSFGYLVDELKIEGGDYEIHYPI
jgi:hypothetical protein